MEEWWCNSTHSQPWYKMEVTEQPTHYGHLIPGKEVLLSPEEEAGWVPKSVWMLGVQKNLLSLPGIEPHFLSYPICSLVIIPTLLTLCYASVSINKVLFYFCEELIYIQVLYMLNSLDITSKFCIITIFPTVDSQKIFYT